MKKNILEIYSLVVCGVSLIWGIVLIGTTLYACVSIITPELTIPRYENSKYLTNDDYYELCCKHKEKAPVFTEEELTKKRIEAHGTRINEEKRSALQDIIKSSIYLILNLFTFTAHWVIAKKSRESGAVI
jgi:hypothetical protein